MTDKERECAAERVRAYIAKMVDLYGPDGDPRFEGGLGIGFADAPISLDDLRALSAPVVDVTAKVERLRANTEGRSGPFDMGLRMAYDDVLRLLHPSDGA